MRLLPRNHVVTDDGFMHQSWTIVYPDKDPKSPSLRDLILTLDIRPDRDVKVLHGMYREVDYIRKIAEIDYIQKNLLDSNSDKNAQYIIRKGDEILDAL